MEKFKPCGCLTDGRNWLPECKEHENVRRQLRAAQRLNTPNPAPHAAEPMVPTGDYREIHLGVQPSDTEPEFVVCSDKGVVQNIQYQGKIYVELQPHGPNDRISGIRLVKLMQGQRDECAEVLREIMAKLREQFGPTCMDQSIDPHAWTLAWETLTSRAYAVLSKCPSYAQQVQNICDGLGITREELDEALKRIPATGSETTKE